MAHIEALRALEEAGLAVDKIGGASMGSIIAAFAGQGRSYDDMLDASIREFRTGALDITVPLVSLVKAKKLSDSLDRLFGGWDIADLWTPYYAVTTNLTTADLSVHRRGCLATVIRESAAIPVLLPPVPIDGDLNVDGGVLDNVPVSTMAADNSIGTVIAIDALRNRLSKRRTSVHPAIGETLMRSMLIGSSKAKSDSMGMVDLYLDLDLSGVGLLKFENHQEVVARGYAEAQLTIAAWS